MSSRLKTSLIRPLVPLKVRTWKADLKCIRGLFLSASFIPRPLFWFCPDLQRSQKKALHNCNSFHPLCMSRIVCVSQKATFTPTSQRIGRICIWLQQRVSGNVVCKLNYMAVSLSLYRSMSERLSGRFCKLSKISIMSITYSDTVN